MFRRSPSVVVLPGRTETQYVTREVHEHRAPTDESVKLLREMEQAADAKRIAVMKLEGNEFKGLVEVIQHMVDHRTEAVAVFDLNGKRLTARADVDDFTGPATELLLKLRDAVARELANEVLIEFTRRLPKGMPR
jgi:hypothetical protein